MNLHVDSEEARSIIVFLNNKVVTHFICAEEGSNGWIEVVDADAMSPLYSPEAIKNRTWDQLVAPENNAKAEVNSIDDEGENELEGWAPLKTKKIYGRVEFKNLS